MTKIRETYSRTRAFYCDLEDARLLWEMLKIEIRAATIAYSKKKAKATTNRELEITRQLEILDCNICDNFNYPDIARILKEFIIKFRYNARPDWLKQRALSEYRCTVSRHQPVCKMPGVLSLFLFVFYSDVLYNLENENQVLASMDIDHPVRNSTNNTVG